MAAVLGCDVTGSASSLPHFWEHTVDSGHATLALRADRQAQMRRVHDELGFAHVRFHGLLCDDMGTPIGDFIGFCAKSQLPADFISTHHYPTDAFGQPGDDTEAQLSKSRRSGLRDETREVRRQAGDRPVFYTEWCTSSNPRNPIATETVQVRLANAPPPVQVTIRRIDADHANAKGRWLEMGSPDDLSAEIVPELNAASRCEAEAHPFDFQDGTLGLAVTLPPLSVASVTVRFAARDGG